jgi:CubicO group peptidase (beta-lactamase class C family)
MSHPPPQFKGYKSEHSSSYFIMFSSTDIAIQQLYPLSNSGCSVGVLEKGQSESAKNYGWKYKGWFSSEAVTPNSLFQACSMSKPVFAVVVLILVQNNLLTLDQDVNEYLVGTGYQLQGEKGEKATIRQLLSHTAGTNVHGFIGYHIKAGLPTSTEIVQGKGDSDKVEITGVQGEYAYSGGGYQVVQLAVENTVKKPFHQIAKEVLFEPLGMKASTFEILTDVSKNDLAHSNGPWKGYYTFAYSWPFKLHPESGAAGLWTNAEEYLIFMKAILDSFHGVEDSILNKELCKDMLSSEAGYGLGWQLHGDEVGHTGSNIGFRCEFLMNLKTRDGFVFFRNSETYYREYYDVKAYFCERFGFEVKRKRPEEDTWLGWAGEWVEAIRWKFNLP